MPYNSLKDYSMTWKPILEQSKLPLYSAIVKQLEQDILEGKLKPGTKLPPQRELAGFLDINVSTVSRAFKICEKKGLLSGITGSGTFVSYDIESDRVISNNKKTSIIQMGSMMPETIMQSEMITLLQEMMGEADFSRLFQYMHTTKRWHKKAAVELLKKVGCKTQAERILTASGGQNAISCIFAGLFQPGDRIGTDPFVSPGLKAAANLFGIQLIPIFQENGEISLEGLGQVIKKEKIKGIYVMPDFQNPTTYTMSNSCRKKIAEAAKKYDLLVIEDGINSLLTDVPMETVANLVPDHTIYIFSLSKTIVPGLRLSYLSVPERYYHQMETTLYNINLSQSALLCELAARLIVSGHLDTLLERRCQGLEQRNQMVDEILAEFDVKGGRYCLSRWLILPNSMTGATFERLALERGVFVYGSERFAVGKNIPKNAARLAVGSPSSLEELRQGLIVLREILQSV